MKFFDGLINQLFPERKPMTKQEKEILVREPIQQPESFSTAYRKWIEEELHCELIKAIYNNYQKRLAGSTEGINLFLHNTTNSNGFYFRAEEPWNAKDYAYLIQFFITKLLDLEYHPNNAVREILEEKDAVYMTESFYLRPKLKFKRKVPYGQLFGNIMIEHRLKNGETDLVKIMVNSFTDHHYKPAFDFEDLMTEFFVN